MNYNANIHHRQSIRLQGYDYSQAGLYFITICCDKMICRFGTIENEQMLLNDAGKIADECWMNIPVHFPSAILHPHIVMPNHIHGIIELSIPDVGAGDFLVGAENLVVGAEDFLPQQPIQQNKFQNMIPRSIGSIVKGFKIGVSKWFRQNDGEGDVIEGGDVIVVGTDVSIVGAENLLPLRPKKFEPKKSIWQRNYYEHIIRDWIAYQNIANYIVNNPSKWNEDKFHFRG